MLRPHLKNVSASSLLYIGTGFSWGMLCFAEEVTRLNLRSCAMESAA